MKAIEKNVIDNEMHIINNFDSTPMIIDDFGEFFVEGEEAIKLFLIEQVVDGEFLNEMIKACLCHRVNREDAFNLSNAVIDRQNGIKADIKYEQAVGK